jgi:hypothetical protein
VSKVKEVLVRAKDLVSKGWTQRARARDVGGKICNFASDEACSFCLVGALSRAEVDLNLDAWEKVRVRGVIGDSLRPMRALPLAFWNDRAERTQEEAVRLLDAVIKEMNDV